MSEKISGIVASIGPGGNLVTDINNDQVKDAPRDESLVVKFGDHSTVGLYESGHDQPASTLVATLGDTGSIEIEIVGISVSDMLGIKAGTVVEISW